MTTVTFTMSWGKAHPWVRPCGYFIALLEACFQSCYPRLKGLRKVKWGHTLSCLSAANMAWSPTAFLEA